MLARYHRWIYENYKIELVEVLREWVIQETGFQIQAVETIQGLQAEVKLEVPPEKHPLPFLGGQIQVLRLKHK